MSFSAASYTAIEGGSPVTITVELSDELEESVTIPITTTNLGGASNDDYSGVPASVTFSSGDTEKSFTFSATQDTDDDDDESVKLAFGTLPISVTAGMKDETTVNITDDDDPVVKVSYEQSSYTVGEGSSVAITVTLNAAPERTVTIPITTTNQGGASASDYSGVPASLTFNSGDTEKSFTFSATQDTDNDDGESVKLAFGTLPTGVTAGTTNETKVNITDDDVPSVTVSYEQSSYTVGEGSRVAITVTLSAAPERTVTIPITTTNQGGAANADYSGVPASLTFNSGDTAKSFSFAAVQDTDDDDGESVLLAFGALPTRVSAGSNNESTVSISDGDVPAVTVGYEQSMYTVGEGSSVAITVTLSADPERTVVIPIARTNQGGAANADYSGVPASLTFNSGDTAKSFIFTAVQDNVDDDGELVLLAFGALPARVSAGSNNESTVSISDDDVPAVTVGYEQSMYTVGEGSSVAITVTLSADPERTVVIPIARTNQGGAANADYSGVPASLTFNSGDTAKSFIFTAVQDNVDDDGESANLAFGTLPTAVSAGSPATATVNLLDDDASLQPILQVAASFAAARYTAAEGGNSASVTVELDADASGTFTIPFNVTLNGGASAADYSGVPASVTFNSGDREQTFTVTATDDSVDDDGESLTLAFGTLPDNVSPGSLVGTTIDLQDNDGREPNRPTTNCEADHNGS